MIEIKVITDLKEAESLWRALSPRETIYDEWDFRYCFYKYNPYPLKFITAYDNNEAVGLLPLERHPKHGLEFIAEDPCEENRPFFKKDYESILPDLYGAVDEPAKFFDISGDDEFTKSLPLEDYKYYLPLSGINSFEDFLNQRLSTKRRNSLKKELDNLEKNNIKIIRSQGKEMREDLERLFNFNVSNFSDESYLLDKDRSAWHDLTKLDFYWRLISLNINNQKEAVSLSVIYNNEWYYLVTGVNFKAYPGLGKYLVKINLEEAIANSAVVFDAGLGACGWKNLWHFDEIPQYEFIKEDLSPK